MKIGILTYQRAENYGALLQAYALKTSLQQAGYAVEMVDYWPDYHKNHFRLFNKKTFGKFSFLGKIRYLLLFVFSIYWMIKRKRNFERFMRSKLKLGKKPKYSHQNHTCNDFDVVIYGSDQIWRKQSISIENWFDDWYFASKNIQSKAKIAYAASMGVLDVGNREKSYLEESLKRFNEIAVREKDLDTLLLQLGFNSTLVVDPVFLLKQNVWKELIKKENSPSPNRKYILFYNLLNSQESEAFTKDLQIFSGFEVKEITKKLSFKKRGKRFIKSASIEEFLSLIHNAEFIVSNSFHGVALSIILQKDFYAVGFGEKSSRVITLLDSVGLANRFVNNGNTVDFKTKIDYATVEKKLDSVRIKSFSYLTNAIEKYND